MQALTGITNGAQNHINLIEELYEIQLHITELRCKIVINILLISLPFKEKPATTIKSSRPLVPSFIVGVGRILVSLTGQTVIPSEKGAEFRFHMVQPYDGDARPNHLASPEIF